MRVELMADCLAGVWARHANQRWQVLEQGDIEEALNAAAQIGDDKLQKQSRGLCRARQLHPWHVRTTHHLAPAWPQYRPDLRLRHLQHSGPMTMRLLLATLALLCALPALAQDKQRDLILQCMACHGDDGIAKDKDVPHLAGQNYDYLLNQMKAFQSGQASAQGNEGHEPQDG